MNEDLDYNKNTNLTDTQLQYNIYIKSTETIDIDQLHDSLNQFIDDFTRNYIWNNDRFHLNTKPKQTVDKQFYIYENVVDFGEYIEDEWYIVYILMELTRRFYEKYHVLAQVYDSDDDFILIYLANYLPKWAENAQSMKNRVYIYNGKLHLLQPATNPSQVTYLPASGYLNLNVTQIINSIFDFEQLTCAPVDLQLNLGKRLNVFKNNEKYLLHQSTCRLPANLVWLLNQPAVHKAFLSKAINRFFDKDPSDLKLCRQLSLFKVDPTTNPFIDYRVTFTKYLYSRLKCMDFTQDGDVWSIEGLNDVERERLHLGYKLTCAFEIVAKLELSANNYKNTKAYRQFVANLTQNDYFMSYMEGSKDYSRLLEQANENYLKNVENLNDNLKLTDFVQAVPDGFIEQLQNDVILRQKQECDDKDDWLNVDQTHFDDYLEAYSMGQVNSTYDFDVLSNAFKKFFQNKEADYKPIEKTDVNLIDFNINSIENSLNEILMKKRLDNGDGSGSDSEADSFYEIGENELSGGDEEEEDHEDQNLKEYIKSMDKELEGEKGLSRLQHDGESSDEDEQLNVDLNLVTNVIESYSSQLGLSGPVSNILKSLGI